MAYNQTVMDLSDPAKVQLHIGQSAGNQPDWQVVYSEESIRRLFGWSRDRVMPSFLAALSQVPGILLPQTLSDRPGEGYRVKAPEGEWIPAWKLRDLRSLHSCKLTVTELWESLTLLCDTLEDLRSLGVWGWTKQSRLLLRRGGKQDRQTRFFLTDVVDYNIYRFSQKLPPLPETEEDLTTKAFRTLLGEMALCANRQALLFDKEDASALEIQLGTGCVGRVSEFFRTPSQLSPQYFLQQAKEVLIEAAKSLDEGNPHELRLYIVLLGGSCYQADVPALSRVVRAFQYAVECLGETCGLSNGKVTCIFPWESVQIRDFDSKVILGLSALPWQEPPRRQVPWGGLLDCLDQELERSLSRGTAPLVFCIELPDQDLGLGGKSLSCMEQYLAEKLRQKEALGVFQLLACSSEVQRPSRLMDYLLSGEDLRRQAQIITNEEELSPKLYAAMKELLKEPRYVFLN